MVRNLGLWNQNQNQNRTRTRARLSPHPLPEHPCSSTHHTHNHQTDRRTVTPFALTTSCLHPASTAHPAAPGIISALCTISCTLVLRYFLLVAPASSAPVCRPCSPPHSAKDDPWPTDRSTPFEPPRPEALSRLLANMEEYRFRPQYSPRDDAPPMNPLVSPQRNGGPSRMPQPKPTHDPRTQLPRRFTTDSGRVPTLSTMPSATSPQRSSDNPQEFVRLLSSVLDLATNDLSVRPTPRPAWCVDERRRYQSIRRRTAYAPNLRRSANTMLDREEEA